MGRAGKVVVGALAEEAGMKAVLDTSVLIDAANGEPGALRHLDTLHPGDALYSAVTLCELLAGTPADGEGVLASFLENLKLCEVTEEIGREAGQLRRRYLGRGLSTQDALIAATAIVYRAILVTRDRDHLGIEGLEVVTP